MSICSKQQKPEWLKIRVNTNCSSYDETAAIVKNNNINTICFEGACPNVRECWKKKHAAFMILGNVCTRSCAFCNVSRGDPRGVTYADEPLRVANAVKKMGLRHVVITSVTRDDLADGGAKQFAECVKLIRAYDLSITVELLVPDFTKKSQGLKTIIDAKPDVFNHNMETVRSLYKKIKPGSKYDHRLEVLQQVKTIDKQIFTKSGIMLGLGEKEHEISEIMDDLRAANVDFLTIGQYLQPTSTHAPVVSYIHPKQFSYYGDIARNKGFKMVSSSPFTRSSYHAADSFMEFKKSIEQTS